MSHRPTLVLALASLAACAGQSVPPAEPAPATQPAPVEEPSTGVSEEVARQAAAADSTRNAYTQADIDFMAGG